VKINDLARSMLKNINVEGKLSIEYGPPLIGDIMEFDVSNAAIKRDLNIEFNQDFWGTLKVALSDSSGFLNR
jgi:hypothetical protein